MPAPFVSGTSIAWVLPALSGIRAQVRVPWLNGGVGNGRVIDGFPMLEAPLTSVVTRIASDPAVVASVLPFTALPDTKRRMPAGMLVNRAARRVPESATPAIPVSAVPVLVAPVLTKPDSELYT